MAARAGGLHEKGGPGWDLLNHRARALAFGAADACVGIPFVKDPCSADRCECDDDVLGRSHGRCTTAPPSAFREETPPEYLYLLDDLFETITLYENRALSAKVTPNADGTFDVVLKVVAKKVRSNDEGAQTDLDFEDYVDVGALDAQGTVIWLEKRKVRKGESELRFVVPKRPAKVGIDPLNTLIDRDSNDNVIAPN